jgi:predicted dehydrogenase
LPPAWHRWPSLHAYSESRRPASKVTLGFIGVGVHGLEVNLMSFLQQDDCEVLAVCDVFRSRRARAREAVEKQTGRKGCAEIADFRALLARPDIDVVVISTPDHWHVPMALMALAAGKHVFCEKPTLTIAEGRELARRSRPQRETIRGGPRGPRGHLLHKLAEVVRNGGIGVLERIRVGLPRSPAFPIVAPAPVPPTSILRCGWARLRNGRLPRD